MTEYNASLNPFSSEAMSQSARFLATDDEGQAVADNVDQLAASGYTVLTDLLDEETLAAARDELDRLMAETPDSSTPFGGYGTKRAFNLLGRSRAFDPLVGHPLVVAAVEAHLQDQIQLSEVSTVTLGPSENAQMLHFDDGCYPLPRPHEPLMVSVMWAMDDFTEVNGATRIVPGSHLDPDPAFVSVPTEPLLMSAGSAGLWDGRTVHGGGANNSDRPRRGIAVLYARAWLRQQENQYLCLDRSLIASFDRRYQRLLGWCTYGPHTGIVEGRDPKGQLRGL